MMGFRGLLIALFAVLFIYTGVVIENHGWNLLPVFFGDMAKMEWPGQFNLDFMFMLSLSALWVAWRHQFSAAGLARELGCSVATIRQARRTEGTASYRTSPKGWEKAVLRLAEQKHDHFKRLVSKLRSI